MDVLIDAGEEDNNPNTKANTIVRRVKARTFRYISESSEDDDDDIDMQYSIHKTVKIKVRRSGH